MKCRLVTDFPDRFHPGLHVFVGEPPRELTIQDARVTGDTVFLQFEQIEDRTLADSLRGAEVRVARADAVPLPAGQYFWKDVLGLRVEDGAGQVFGTVKDILATGANDVYVVEGASGELLVPAIRDVVKDIDPSQGRMVIEPLEGLLPSQTPRSRRRRTAPR